MLKRATYRFLLAVILVAIAFIMGSSGCKTVLPGVVTTVDSTHTATVIYHRDTTIHINADSARIVALVRNAVEMRKLMEELRTKPRIARGLHNASITMSVRGDSLIVDARCDSIAQKLEDAITVIETLKSRYIAERTVLIAEAAKAKAAKAEKAEVPGWMTGIQRWLRGITWLGGIGLVGYGLFFIRKLFFKRP